MPPEAHNIPHDPNTCPRCGGGVPNEEMRGQYPGALSRTDNVTEVCSNCGTMEAMAQIGGVLESQADWPLEGGPTRSLQDILSDQASTPFPSGVDDLGDGRFLIRRGHEDPDAGPRLSNMGPGSLDFLRDGNTMGGGGPDMNRRGPDYSQPDPFDTSDPAEAAQSESIAETEQLFSQWDEERDRRRRWLDGRDREL